MLVIGGACFRGGLYSGGAYIRDFTVCLNDSKLICILQIKYGKFLACLSIL